jgi:hypothetical protein
MATKAQHACPTAACRAAPRAARGGRTDAARLGKKLKKPQSWVYNCETGNRRVDVGEFVLWAKACKVEPEVAFGRFLKLV